MITKLWDNFHYFFQRTANNLDIFCFSTFIIIVGSVLLYIVSKLLYKIATKSTKSKETVVKLEILLIPFIAIFLICAASLMLESWTAGKRDAVITDANVLMATVSFISPFIAFTGAYSLSEMNYKKSEFIRKQQEDDAEDKQEQYALDMLYSLLSFTIKEQHELWQLYALRIVQEYELRYGIDEIETLFKDSTLYEMLAEPYEIGEKAEILNGIINDIEFSDKEDKESKFNVRGCFSELIYDKNWTAYLYYINKENREHIVKWFNYLEENKTRMSITLIIEYREKVLQILQELGFTEMEEESLEVLIQFMIESDAYKKLEISESLLGK